MSTFIHNNYRRHFYDKKRNAGNFNEVNNKVAKNNDKNIVFTKGNLPPATTIIQQQHFPVRPKSSFSNCQWPLSDTLFIIDSTLYVGGASNHRKILQFVGDVTKLIFNNKSGHSAQILKSNSRLALVQFTPELKFEFSFVGDKNFQRTEQKINNINYLPCHKWEYCEQTRTSWNTIVKWMSKNNGRNRLLTSNVIVLISTELYQPPVFRVGEILAKPHSPIHVFQIIVGKAALNETAQNFQFAATTAHLAVDDFDSLPQLVEPLCKSVQSFLGDSRVLKNVEFLTGPLCAFCIILSTVLSLVVISALIYALNNYKHNNDQLKRQISYDQKNTRRQEEYYQGKLQERVEHDRERERTMLSLVNESTQIREQVREELGRQDQSMQKIVPVTWIRKRSSGNNEGTELIQVITNKGVGGSKVELAMLGRHREKTQTMFLVKSRSFSEPPNHLIFHDQPTPLKAEQNPAQQPNIPSQSKEVGSNQPYAKIHRQFSYQLPLLKRVKRKMINRQKRQINEREDKSMIIKKKGLINNMRQRHNNYVYKDDDCGDEDSAISNFDDDHPALILPPVDIMLLIDASSSIGIRNFEQLKGYIQQFVDNVDVSPGRSRIALIIFAAEPQLYFDFDRYYSNNSVRAAIRRMPYLGGPTFLAKALSFTAGVMCQEQSFKRTETHLRFLPKLKHNRPQVLVVVSDGVSHDNYDRQATRLHKHLYVKVAAIATRRYIREKLRSIARYNGAIFTVNQMETLSIWLWNVQKMWNEKFGDYIEPEKLVV